MGIGAGVVGVAPQVRGLCQRSLTDWLLTGGK